MGVSRSDILLRKYRFLAHLRKDLLTPMKFLFAYRSTKLICVLLFGHAFGVMNLHSSRKKPEVKPEIEGYIFGKKRDAHNRGQK